MSVFCFSCPHLTFLCNWQSLISVHVCFFMRTGWQTSYISFFLAAGLSREHLLRWSGTEVARFCGVLTGQALVFSQQGERMLVTADLDLTHGRYAFKPLFLLICYSYTSHAPICPAMLLLFLLPFCNYFSSHPFIIFFLLIPLPFFYSPMPVYNDFPKLYFMFPSLPSFSPFMCHSQCPSSMP